MKVEQVFILLFGLLSLTLADNNLSTKFICYYNATDVPESSPFDLRIDPGLLPQNNKNTKTTAAKQGYLYNCTHLVVGFAKINNKTHKVELPNYTKKKNLLGELKKIRDVYKDLTIILAIGGEYEYDNQETYYKVLTDKSAQTRFVNSVKHMAVSKQFDGFDLEFPFPQTEVNEVQQNPPQNKGGLSVGLHVNAGVSGNVGVGVGQNNRNNNNYGNNNNYRNNNYNGNNYYGYNNYGQSNTNNNGENSNKKIRDGFTALLNRLQKTLANNINLIVTVLPNVDEYFFDVRNIATVVNFINIADYDVCNPERNPKSACNACPLTYARNLIKTWIQQGASEEQIVLGVTGQARTWSKDIKDYQTFFNETSVEDYSVPPVSVDGVAQGLFRHGYRPGYLDYDEICSIVSHRTGRCKASNVNSDEGTVYAYCIEHSRQTDGDLYIWISYENPDTLRIKAEYVKQNSLGGIAFMNLNQDDHAKFCTNNKIKFPLLTSIVNTLSV